ncbi:hypothetical protein ABIE65_002250 [Constrictibacter sp. MBR-5]|jgi:hypothetical protein|uniref:hypothetical protein n=1 Tax=Constrictibacter sp. MBR-5 TaxID=3156467 RepID=UPI003396A2A1
MSGVAALLRLTLASWGLLVWSVAFVVLYGGLSLGCAAGAGQVTLWEADRLAIVLAAVWIAHLLLVVLPGVVGRRKWVGSGGEAPADHARATGFLWRLMRMLLLVGAVATLWIGLPVLVLPPCW